MGFFSTDHLPAPVLPPRRTGANTVKPAGEEKVCPACGTPYTEGKDFCLECGRKKGIRHSKSMNGRIKAVEVAKYLNNWLAENPYLYDIKLDCRTHFLINDFDRVGQVSVSDVSLSYCVAQQEQPEQYGVVYLYSYRATMNFRQVMNVTCAALVGQWQMLHQDVDVVDWSGGKTNCMENGTYHLYALVVYRKKAAAPAPARKFCSGCGAKLTVENAAFCGNCGKRL